MKSLFRGWAEVGGYLEQEAAKQESIDEQAAWLNAGQCASLRAIAQRIPNNGVIIADEVGMGKTRIAVAVANSVVKARGRVAILIPPGLGFQWDQELRDGGLKDVPPILRSLWAYLAAWEPEDAATQAPWFGQQVVVISHAFANWRLSDSSDHWRRALLPEVYALWHLKRDGRLPRFYIGNDVLSDLWVHRAGKSIVDAIPLSGPHPGRHFLEDLLEKFEWTGSLDGDYSQGTDLRKWLEGSVGLGLGLFDLVIIDEAHKSRGSDTGLSRLLANLVFQTSAARRLGMTATPVELDVSQWLHTLARIGVSKTALDQAKGAIAAYSQAARQIRQCWRGSEEARSKYRETAIAFREALSPFVLRRDKREDRSVQLFEKHSALPVSRYRVENEIPIDIDQLSLPWQQAVCAAEALSFSTRLASDPVAKRLRLTLGNGHGIAALLDQVKHDDVTDKKQDDFDQDQHASDSPVGDTAKVLNRITDKRQVRAQWWHSVIVRAFGKGDDPLFEHPAILAAVIAIEESTRAGEKVLVFGRFTLPMRRLVDLLNAREMFFALDKNEPWPQASVHGTQRGSADESEWPAVRAAHRQLKDLLRSGELDEAQLDRDLQRQYNRFESRRQRFRERLVDRMREGFTKLGLGENDKYLKAFEAFRRSVAQAGQQDLLLVSRALLELLSPTDAGIAQEIEPTVLAQSFCDLIKSASDRDDPDVDEDGDGVTDVEKADILWSMLKGRINEEYSRTQGSFARFMYGNTSPHSRRMIQLAFNRQNIFPKVLVAQSMVGREGLNLHKACRIVVMLHPEWNPGVAEQQIGRVDRVASHWSMALQQAIDAGLSGERLPRIEVRPVIFRGTYDEHNWSVLRERWDDLRAQLHGIVVPDRFADQDEESKRIIESIAQTAPSFSPLPICR